MSAPVTSGILNAKNWDAKIPIPYHCLQRLLSAVSYSGVMSEGSALHRDFVITENLINEELRKTNNVQ